MEGFFHLALHVSGVIRMRRKHAWAVRGRHASSLVPPQPFRSLLCGGRWGMGGELPVDGGGDVPGAKGGWRVWRGWEGM